MVALIELKDVTRTFGQGRDKITAVDNISLAIQPGEIVCLVGESGCGKSTTGSMVAGLLPVSAGQVLYMGQDITRMNRAQFKQYRHGVQIVHQDPYASLNPTQTIEQMLTAPADGPLNYWKSLISLQPKKCWPNTRTS
jgi:peptide/nickel transport system ATP-binding protein